MPSEASLCLQVTFQLLLSLTMTSLPDTKTGSGTTAVAIPSSKKPGTCVRQGFNFLICTVLLVAMTYLSIYSDVINIQNIEQDVARSDASNDTGSGLDIDGVERKAEGRCKEKTRFAFIKVHKAGSTTVQYIFQRFGHRRHLHFVLPSRPSVNIGWPYLMKKEDYMQPIPGRPFDVLVFHTVYNREIFVNLLPNNTVYLAIVREPYSHLQSVINFFHLRRLYGLPKDDPVQFFLQSPAELEGAYFQSHNLSTFSKTKNLMAYDLGIPTKMSENEDYVHDYIAQLDRDFLLVMVLEYFDESLVLLKRYMCWQLSDILYKVQNSRNYTYRETYLPQRLRENHKNWSKADYKLYQHFNRTLWEKIANEGADFYSEVKQFKHLNHMTSQICEEEAPTQKSKVLDATAWNERFVVDSNFCRLLNMDDYDYRQVLTQRHCKDAKTTVPKIRHNKRCAKLNRKRKQLSRIKP
ncbi:galactose-3-O-sulfotransferase 2-like isoform X2 [Branchiostoma floridae x Branchiostoma japonicum]